MKITLVVEAEEVGSHFLQIYSLAALNKVMEIFISSQR